ncbi:protein of unknown function [Rhodovastum atsumiense]|nr:protein of unknown function [Rhodovastum atsumiense]
MAPLIRPNCSGHAWYINQGPVRSAPSNVAHSTRDGSYLLGVRVKGDTAKCHGEQNVPGLVRMQGDDPVGSGALGR